MVLKALELQGFKSFPDKTVLEFDRGMTAVVGPNGSGKSNISDAVRWVLGEQSTKNLRGSKMEDVIFGGTDKRRALGYAEVTLRLDNSDGTLPYDKKEVSVTRRYFRSGESEYRINGEQVRLKDVNELFMDTGLGRDGYSMVSQGKVADMISGKSSGRRDMLEEAAGISHFRYRRTDAIRRLDRAEENLVRLRDILAELESRVGPLKTQSEKAQKFLVLAEQKKTLEISLWLYTIDNLKTRLTEQEHKVEVSQAQYHDAEEALAKIEADTEAATEAVRNITLQIEEIRMAASGDEEQIADRNAKIAVAENTIELNNQAIARLEQDKESHDAEQEERRGHIAEANEAIAALQARIDEKQAEMEAIAKESEDFQAAISRQEESQDSHAKELSELAAKLSDARIRKSAAETAIEEVRDRTARAEESAGERRTLHLNLATEVEKAKKHLEECNETVTSLQNSIDGYVLRQQKRNERLAARRESFEALRRESEQKSGRVRMLEDLEKNIIYYFGAPLIYGLLPDPWSGIVTAFVTLFICGPFLWSLMRQGGNSANVNKLWYEGGPTERIKLTAWGILRLAVGAAFISYIIGNTLPKIGMYGIFAVIAVVLYIFNSSNFKKRSDRMTKTFTENLHEREHNSSTNN